jgi:hypothetical protein
MNGRSVFYNGVELTTAEGSAGDWLFDVRVQGVLVGRIRRNPFAGTYRYHSLAEREGGPRHEGNDLGALLNWVAHKP